jgi:hypothetical protein
MGEPTCPGCRALSLQVAQLQAQVADLTRRLNEATRAGKRATGYAIDPCRSAAALEEMIGADGDGSLCPDGFAS